MLLLLCVSTQAQKFYNLTAEEVRIDSLLPQFTRTLPLAGAYQDSVYTVSIVYPEFIDMSAADVARYRRISGPQPAALPPALPSVAQHVGVSRRRGVLDVAFCPVVYREGRYRLLVSFMLSVTSRAKSRSARRQQQATRAAAASRYAAHSVLATGRWAKIRVAASGVHELTEAVVRRAGFTDISRVHIYGYGGALQSEALSPDELERTDDLREIPVCLSAGRRLFWAQGPVSWASQTARTRTRNPYSSYGYYFITQTDQPVETVDEAAFRQTCCPVADDCHWLHEVDDFAWYEGGRNLCESAPIDLGRQRDYPLPRFTGAAWLTVVVTAGTESEAQVSCDGTPLGTVSLHLGSYDKGSSSTRMYRLDASDGAEAGRTVTIAITRGGPVRLDYIALTYDEPQSADEQWAARQWPEAGYACNVTPQDLHAHGAADMVIIIPASQTLRAEAERLARAHEQHDGMRVSVVAADELYNEFASGTPDANAYRRYLKMLYDRAETERDMPGHLLLFGDCLWDNRLLSSAVRGCRADDYLLCYESENSYSETDSYVDDGFFCLLDDGEGVNPQSHDKLDLAVGRFPVTTQAEARAMVDKTIAYMENRHAGAWQNTLVFMGDDGNQNTHMRDVDDAARQTAALHPGFTLRKVMWDAYPRVTVAAGNRYPEVTAAIKRYQAAGALVMDYAGHGSPGQLSHEAVLWLSDFQQTRSEALPLWITASCDIMPFDGTKATIGEAAVLNAGGGAVAFFGTARTVYTNYNKAINMAFLRHALAVSDGRPATLGEAQRLTKNELLATGADRTNNKLQYSLLGDPALRLAVPTLRMVVDSIGGRPVAGGGETALSAGSVVRVAGHIEDAPDFRGVATVTVSDAEERVTCRLNDTGEADEPFQYTDRPRTLFTGSDSVRSGRFAVTFAVPRDISYTGGTGLIHLYAASADHSQTAHGAYGQFTIAGGAAQQTDSIGPSVYCYLNSPAFENGGQVNTTPYFVAEIADEDGINAAGSGIGHDLTLTIDGERARTYVLNDHFAYDFGSFTRGTTYYNIPELEPGRHRLMFRAWDVMNNPTTTWLDFTVTRGLEPHIFSVDVSRNPATTYTSFIVAHDRTGSAMDVEIEVMDMSGRLLWTHTDRGVYADGAYTLDWDLSLTNGGRLSTGVYLYRVRLASDGSKRVSRAKKLIVVY